MFFLVTLRQSKHSTGATEKFAPRTGYAKHWYVDGPFSKRPLAERAAVSALGTHTCLSSQVYTTEQLVEIAARSYNQEDYDFHTAIQKAVAIHKLRQ